VAASLDEVIIAHDAYLAEILDRSLLGPHHEALNTQIQRLLECILRFCSLEESLVADAMVLVSQKKARNQEAADRTAKGGWGVTSNNAQSDGPYDGIPDYLVNRIDECVRDYGLQFDILMAMLREGLTGEKTGQIAGEIVRFLTFRLDFNDYYTQAALLSHNFSPGSKEVITGRLNTC